MKITFIVLVILIMIDWVILNTAYATPSPDITINNYYERSAPIDANNLEEGTVNNISVTSGMSDKDVARAMSVAASLGGHHFDFSTTDHQVAVNYAFETDHEEEGAASIAYARNFKKVSWMPNALIHVEYSGNSDYSMVMFGGTFRIK